jgi:N-acetylglucosamine kinase-like BadF-type ATPase
MKQNMIAILPLLLGAAVARPMIHRREVPQEHAHQNILDQVDALLQLNNPDNIQASVFGLLGAKAAAEGAGDIEDAGKCTRDAFGTKQG